MEGRSNLVPDYINCLGLLRHYAPRNDSLINHNQTEPYSLFASLPNLSIIFDNPIPLYPTALSLRAPPVMSLRAKRSNLFLVYLTPCVPLPLGGVLPQMSF